MKRILFLLLFVYTSLYPAERRLSWTPVEGALGYYIEIRNSSGLIVVNEMINNSYYDVTKLEPGAYSFRISTVNVLMQRGESSDWISFEVEKLFIPEIKTVSRRELIAGMNNKNIIIRGANFKPQSRFLLRGNGAELEMDDVDIRSETEASVSFKPSASQKGVYDLVVVNRGDVESVLKKAVTIVEIEEAETPFYFGVYYSVNVPFSDFSGYYVTSFTGGGFYLQMSGVKYGFENILLNAGVDAVRFTNTPDSKKSTLTQISAGIGFDYIYPAASAPVELFIRFQTGPVYTMLTMDENLTGKSKTSTDLFALLGGGVRYYTGGDYFIEPSCTWKTVFYTGTFFHDVRVSLGGGTRF